jgi:hypothetical protein
MGQTTLGTTKTMQAVAPPSSSSIIAAAQFIHIPTRNLFTPLVHHATQGDGWDMDDEVSTRSETANQVTHERTMDGNDTDSHNDTDYYDDTDNDNNYNSDHDMGNAAQMHSTRGSMIDE